MAPVLRCFGRKATIAGLSELSSQSVSQHDCGTNRTNAVPASLPSACYPAAIRSQELKPKLYTPFMSDALLF